MTRSTRKRKPHFKNVQLSDPAVKSFRQWLPVNRQFYAHFCRWLREGGYSDSALNIYGGATRLALGWLDKPYWEIDPESDLDRVRAYVADRYDSPATRKGHAKGLAKMSEYLLHCRQRPTPAKTVHWETYLGPLPAWLGDEIRDYITYRRRSWTPEMLHRATVTTLSHLTLFLRWSVTRTTLRDTGDLTPALWDTYVDHRLANGISPVSCNGELGELLMFLNYQVKRGRPVCERMLRVEPLVEEKRLPRDVPLSQLRRLLRAIEDEMHSSHAGKRRMGIMDRAWVLLMLHCGLRTCEVRFLRLDTLDLERDRVLIEKSKGLKDRVVYLSDPATEALLAYLAVRGDPRERTDHVFLNRHKPLSMRYCGARLETYSKRCGVYVTPHQLRHSFGTLLLNAGMPIETLQKLLGHKKIETTLVYSRVYDSTLAAGYYKAMRLIEGAPEQPVQGSELLTLVDVLEAGTLDEAQQEAVQALRAAILSLSMETVPGDESRGTGASVV